MSEVRTIIYAASQVLVLTQQGMEKESAIEKVSQEYNIDKKELEYFLSKG